MYILRVMKAHNLFEVGNWVLGMDASLGARGWKGMSDPFSSVYIQLPYRLLYP